MSSEFTSCHSLVTEQSPASRPGPVQAERSEPKGSLDGWPRCPILRDEGMAGYLVPASIPKVLASSPRFHSHFFAASIGCVPVGVRKSDGCCNLNADLATSASLATRRRSAHYAQSPELGEPLQYSTSLHVFMLLLFCYPCGHAKVRILLR